MEKVKFGVIGTGHIGKRHAEMIQRNPSCELVALCDILSKNKLGLENYPVNRISWFGADAYCRDAAVAVQTANTFMAKKHNQL